MKNFNYKNVTFADGEKVNWNDFSLTKGIPEQLPIRRNIQRSEKPTERKDTGRRGLFALPSVLDPMVV